MASFLARAFLQPAQIFVTFPVRPANRASPSRRFALGAAHAPGPSPAHHALLPLLAPHFCAALCRGKHDSDVTSTGRRFTEERGDTCIEERMKTRSRTNRSGSRLMKSRFEVHCSRECPFISRYLKIYMTQCYRGMTELFLHSRVVRSNLKSSFSNYAISFKLFGMF